MVSYDPTPQDSEEIVGDVGPQADDEIGGGEAGLEAMAGASTPETTRQKREKKRPSSLSDFAEEPATGKRRRRRTATADVGIPSVNVPRDSHEVFNVESSEDE